MTEVMSLMVAQDKVDRLIEAVRRYDEESADRHDAYAECFWNDHVSMVELVDVLRAELADYRRGF